VAILTAPIAHPHRWDLRSWSARSEAILNDFICNTCGAHGREAIAQLSVLADAVRCQCGAWTDCKPIRAAMTPPGMKDYFK
jgi:hypothetical protein